jgi:hypothetical protein
MKTGLADSAILSHREGPGQDSGANRIGVGDSNITIGEEQKKLTRIEAVARLGMYRVVRVGQAADLAWLSPERGSAQRLLS